MVTRPLIDAMPYAPEAREALGHAFDEAWAVIEKGIDSDLHLRESARIGLEAIVLFLATDTSQDIQALKDKTLEIYDRVYKAPADSRPKTTD